MNIYTNLVAEVGRKIQNTSSGYETKIKEFLNRRYEYLWHKYLWKEIIEIDEAITTVSGEVELVLPKTVGEIIALTERANDVVLTDMSPYVYQQKHLDTITDQTRPTSYTISGETGAADQPASASKISFASASASDTTQDVRIWGIASSEEVTESVSLTGTTAAETTNTYTRVDRVSKDADTVGVVTGTAGSVTVVTLAPTEYTARYLKIRLHKVPAAAYTLYLTYKKRFRKLLNDEDVLEFDCEAALISGTYADCLKEQRQFSKAQAEESKFQEIVLTYLMEKEGQGDKTNLMQPHIEQSDIDTQITY